MPTATTCRSGHPSGESCANLPVSLRTGQSRTAQPVMHPASVDSTPLVVVTPWQNRGLSLPGGVKAPDRDGSGPVAPSAGEPRTTRWGFEHPVGVRTSCRGPGQVIACPGPRGVVRRPRKVTSICRVGVRGAQKVSGVPASCPHLSGAAAGRCWMLRAILVCGQSGQLSRSPATRTRTTSARQRTQPPPGHREGGRLSALRTRRGGA